MPFAGCKEPMTEYVLGAIADYEEEELLFTEQELTARIHEIRNLAERYTAGEFDQAPAHYVDFIGQNFDESVEGISFDARCGIDKHDAYAFIPLYSDDGGVTAEITSYAAINRNTKYPREAFLLLDYLASYDVQSTEWLSQYLYTCGDRSSMPMYDPLMSEEERVYLQSGSYASVSEAWCLFGHNHQALCTVRETITNVHFRDALIAELDKLYMEYSYAAEDGENTDHIISEGYRRIQQMLRE